jgi:hypothetical protein
MLTAWSYDCRMDPDRPKLNQKFPACAQVARRLLAEVYGCKPGDLIPGEDVLLAHARQVIESWRAEGGNAAEGTKADFAITMVKEIGGIFERPAASSALGQHLRARPRRDGLASAATVNHAREGDGPVRQDRWPIRVEVFP